MKTFILRERRHLESLLGFIAANWEAMSKTRRPMMVECGPESAKRSIRALRYYWAMLRQVEEQAWIGGRQFSSEVWHEHFKRELLGIVELPNGQTMGISTSTLDAMAFADYVQRVEAKVSTEYGVTLMDLAGYR